MPTETESMWSPPCGAWPRWMLNWMLDANRQLYADSDIGLDDLYCRAYSWEPSNGWDRPTYNRFGQYANPMQGWFGNAMPLCPYSSWSQA